VPDVNIDLIEVTEYNLIPENSRDDEEDDDFGFLAR
jgi:hypothetical protein